MKHIIIPARLESKRFPEKILFKMNSLFFIYSIISCYFVIKINLFFNLVLILYILIILKNHFIFKLIKFPIFI